MSFAIPMFGCLIQWNDEYGKWQLDMPDYRLDPKNGHVWDTLPSMSAMSANLFYLILHWYKIRKGEPIRTSQGLYFKYDDVTVSLNTDDAILDVTLTYGDLCEVI